MYRTILFKKSFLMQVSFIESMLFVLKKPLNWLVYFMRQGCVIKQPITWYITIAQWIFLHLWVIVFTCSELGFVSTHRRPATQRLASSLNWVHQQHWNLLTWEGPGSSPERQLRFSGISFSLFFWEAFAVFHSIIGIF